MQLCTKVHFGKFTMSSKEENGNLPTSESPNNPGEGSGARSLAGYDYQVDVSIWLALDVMLGSGLTQVIELEPGSEEDIEAKLVDEEPGRISTRVGLDDYTLVVQAKLRGGDAWTVKGIERLLKHGSASRPAAKDRLRDPKIRYLLITSAGLNGGARGLAAKHAGSWPKKDAMPSALVNELPEDSAGRVAVIGSLDEEGIVQKIERLLIVRFGVPNSRWINCLQVLRQEARLRIRRAGGGLWRREEVEHVIRKHDGYLASSPKLDSYIQPKNWRTLRDAMMGPNHAVIIVGQSGTGKTLATDKLFEDLRREIPGLARVRIRKGPHELRHDTTPPPVLYDIEDPWGRYSFDSSTRAWNDELSRALSSARADRLVMATSRRDVAVASGGLKSVEDWVVPLEAEHYGKTERKQIYRSRIESLPRAMHSLAIEAEGRVLERLATPLEIDKFFDALRTTAHPKNGSQQSFVTKAINKAHEQSIESTVVQQIEDRKEVSAAAIIWGFLKASDRLSLQMLRDLDLELASRVVNLEEGVTPLVDFFVAARNLRSSSGYVAYYHPRVEAGIEAALKRNSVPACRALRCLFDLLTSPDGPGESFGSECAARIIRAWQPVSDLSLKPTPEVAKKIDVWLSGKLEDKCCKLKEYLPLAAAAGSSASNVSEFARYLVHRPKSPIGGFDFWESPGHSNDWYGRLKQDPAVSALAGRFIEELLPNDNRYYAVSIVDDLDRLAINLTGAYLRAAAQMVYHGVSSSCDVISAGALRDLEGFEPIVDAAIGVCTPAEAECEDAREARLAIINEVYNADYADHLSENDDGYTAWEFLDDYAIRARNQNGWQFLAEHRQAEGLLKHWMRALSKDAESLPPSDDEMKGAFLATCDTESEETFWDLLKLHWNDAYRPQLVTRIQAGSAFERVRHAALACLIKHAPDILTWTLEQLGKDGNRERAVELMIDLANIGKDDENAYFLDDVCKNLDEVEPVCAELLRAACDSVKNPFGSLSKVATEFLTISPLTSLDVRRFRIRRHREVVDNIRVDIEWVLFHGEDRDTCVEAIEAAINLRLTDIVDAALGHQFAHVVAKALAEIAARGEAPLPERLLALADDKRSPVRNALVRVLASKSHRNHLPALLHLVKDQWSTWSQHYGEDDKFPIARLAVDALASVDSFTPSDLETLLAAALETSDAVVRNGLLRIVGGQGGREYHDRLLELTINPGRTSVRREAAFALLLNNEALDETVVQAVNVHIIQTVPAPVAAPLTILAAIRMTAEDRFALAQGLSVDPKRRALLLLMLWPWLEVGDETLRQVTRLLPENHASISWVSQGPVEIGTDDLISDLGDPITCREVLNLLNPKPEKV